MSPDFFLLTPAERAELETTALVRHRLEEQFENLEEQHEVSSLGMWVFLGTEVMFFGTLFLGLAVYTYQYHPAFERASTRLNWFIGGLNTAVLLVSSLFMVLAVHFAKLGQQKRVVLFLALTAALGVTFLGLKSVEYIIDYQENLIPGWKFDEAEWVTSAHLAPEEQPLRPDQVPQVKLFLLFYWIMTSLHALHVTIGIACILVMLALARRGTFSTVYYSPLDVTGLYWHFVDSVWIFLLPMLYLLGTHTL